MRVLLALLAAVGITYAVFGMDDPWTRVESRGDPVLRALQRFVVYPSSSYSR